jgi:ABC-type amino acid transport substrate-binding protein
VAAFQNAHLFLGNDFAAMAAGNQDYREPPQTSINRMLYARRIDVGISDINVFKGINDELKRESSTLEPWCPYALFPPTQYRLAFRNRNARDLFNKALKRALKGELYESLSKRYHLPSISGHPYFKPRSPTRGQG